MRHPLLFAPALAISAFALALSGPADAGKADRARAAIATAKGKIDAASAVGVATELPRQHAAAKAALATAEEDLAAGRKEAAIAAATHASEIADSALGETQKRKEAAASVQQSVSQANAEAAQ